MARNFKDVVYTKVDLDSPHKDFQARDTSVGLADGDEDDDVHYDGSGGGTSSDRAQLLRDGSGANGADSGEADDNAAKKPGVLSMAYYQRFFNVDTNQVGKRILGSFVPRPGRNQISDDIRHSPDLYGPFWVCTTLIFTTAIAGNLADYFQTSAAGDDYVWVYDFRKVTFAATAIYVYWWLVPLLLWAVCWWRQVPEKYAYLELLCLYGYSLSFYIPVSVLCVIQFAAVQWAFVLLALLLSGSVLALSLWPSVSSGERRTAVGLLTAAMVLHAALAVGFKLYFFHVSSSAGGSPGLPTSLSTASGLTFATTPASSVSVKSTGG